MILLIACTAPSSDSPSSESAHDSGTTESTPSDSGPEDSGSEAGPEVSLAAVDLEAPVDAAPSPDGSTFYVVTENAGLWTVPADGSAEPVLLDDGLREATGLQPSLDGSEIFVAASRDGGERNIEAVQLDGSGAVPHPEVLGLDPGGLSGMLSENRASHAEDIVFTGRRSFATGDEGAVFLFPPHGLPTELATGFGGYVPTAVEVAPDRSVYVSAVDGDAGSVWHIPAEVVAAGGSMDPEGAAELLLEGYGVGAPAGLALTLDGSTLLLSSLSEEGGAQVVILDLASGQTSIFSDGIGENPAAGGLHRARDADVFAWVDSEDVGCIYRVALR